MGDYFALYSDASSRVCLPQQPSSLGLFAALKTSPALCRSYSSPPSPQSSVNSDSDSQFSDESVASSQTSYSCEEQWPIQVQADPRGPVGKTSSPPEHARFQPARHQHPRRTAARDAPVPGLVRHVEKKGQFVYHLVGECNSS
jgi:hypothetical protein